MDFITLPTSDKFKLASDCLIVPYYEASNLAHFLSDIDANELKKIEQLQASGDISHKKGQHSLVYVQTANVKRILFLGCGNSDNFADLRESIISAFNLIQQKQYKSVSLLADAWRADDINLSQLLQQIALLFTTQSYRYDATLSKKAEPCALQTVRILTDNIIGQDNAIEQGLAMAQGINTARHLGNLPANICTPSYLAEQALALAKQYKGLSVEVMDENRLKDIGMNALLAVSAGSREPARVIIFKYQGAADANQAPYVLVGKGVTFDAGGISLKPGARMDEMKFDMCGAASVFGTIQAACELKLPFNIIGIIGATENLPSGSATKPGDVITGLSGQSIEILNTDAEGRLVLSDLLTYVERFNPHLVIDIATLTGACVVALGAHASGLYTTEDELSWQLLSAGQYTYDRAWPMPLWKEYDQQLESNFADIGNIGGPKAGSVTAACFLSRFTKKYPWAHLDIAGTAWLEGKQKGATGRPVSLLTQFFIDRLESM